MPLDHQVLLSPLQQQEGPLLPLQPAKGGGSYASLAQTYGVQRLGEGQGGFMRVVAQQRVLVQVGGPGGACGRGCVRIRT